MACVLLVVARVLVLIAGIFVLLRETIMTEQHSHSQGDQVRIAIFMGVAGSGKTTAGALMASRLGWDFAEADDFHPAANVAKMSAGVPLDDQDRLPWLHDLREWIDQVIATGRHGIVTCSALKRSYRDLLRAPGVVFVHMSGSPATIEARLGARQGHFMPPGLLASQFADLEEVDPDEDHVIVDLDHGLSASQEVDLVLRALGLTVTPYPTRPDPSRPARPEGA
jgi:carbohydrate kinase (thermoresistant glucokinase family)